MKKVLAILLSSMVVLSMAACGGGTPSASDVPPEGNAETLTGVANGYGGVVTVTLTRENGVITDVQIVGDSETTGIGTRAIEELGDAIIAANGPAIDVVAGATVTSNAIIYAVNNALDPVAYPELDATATASIKEGSDPEQLVNALTEDGFWIFSLLDDVVVDQEIVVDGVFHDHDSEDEQIYRKLALYAQDADRNVTASYTLTAPLMTVNSPHFRIQEGTFVGDIYVNAENFELRGTTVEGNLTFASEELMASADIETGTVTGTISVG